MNNDFTFGKAFKNGALINNPVLIQCAGLCPVIAATSTLKNALIISLMLMTNLFVTSLIASAALKKVPRYVRVVIYLIIGIAIIAPILWFIENKTFIELDLGLRICIPIIAVNSLTAVHCETYAVKHTVKESVLTGISSGLGAAFVMLICGAIREIMGRGTLGGYDLGINLKLDAFTMPFGCLLILGVLAAAYKFVLNLLYTPSQRRKSTADENPEEIDLDIVKEDMPEAVDLVIADYDEIDYMFTSTDEFLKSLTSNDGGDGQ